MTHASVFSGIGGPEVAATMLGWENLFHCEINPFGRKVLDYWYPNAKSYEDITTTDFTEWRGRVDVLTGGFPCQPFSYAGRRRGSEDDRYLWPAMYRAIDEIQPTWVVAENVAGILTMVEQGKVSEVASQATLFGEGDTLHRYQLRETFTLERICTDLESHGYAVQPVLIPACAVGAPHRRDRVFIVARRVTADTYHGRQSQSEPTRRQGEHETERARMDDSAQRKSENGNFANTATIPQDSMHSRQLHGQDEVEGSERNERHTCAGGGERICGEISRTTSADTISSREGTSRASGESESSRGDTHQQPSERESATERLDRLHAILRPIADPGQSRAESVRRERKDSIHRPRPVADTEGECGQRMRPEQSETRGTSQEQSGGRGGEDGHDQSFADYYRKRLERWYDCEEGRPGQAEDRPVGFVNQDNGIAGNSRWANFPSVSPIHRGNDGLPFDVDSLTLSFGKWRTEALKAYGNAILPQVMYEIFRAIEIVEQ